MSKLPISLEQIEDITSSIEYDKSNLFSLADQLIAAAPLRRWDIWVSDATSSYFLSQFMCDVFSESDKDGVNPSQVVHIANSRSVRSRPNHQRAVGDYLSRPELGVAGGNALILSEYTKDRIALATLSMPLRRAGALAVDAAVLNVDYPGRWHIAPSQPDRMYKGAPNVYEPELFSGILKDAVGQICIEGHPEPVDAPNANLELRGYVSGAFKALAQEYIAQS